MSRKQQLLKAHRKRKRLLILVWALMLIALAVAVSIWLLPAALILVWLVNEAWFSDHQFYASQMDYQYRFSDQTPLFDVQIEQGRLQLGLAQFDQDDTLVLELTLVSNLLGKLFDPSVMIGRDKQTFERGAKGKRYVNLTGLIDKTVVPSVSLAGRFCRIKKQARLFVFKQPSPFNESVMVLAPHADDAEIAAFGLYSQTKNVSIVTLTQGEIEQESYQRQFGVDAAKAGQLKGRLRSWDSMAIPMWGGVMPNQCVQLGYYCMQLPAMQKSPDKAIASLVSKQADTRLVRRHNSLPLLSDQDGAPSWRNLLADLTTCLQHFKPDVVVLPHPKLDPHPDHIATYDALLEALELSEWQPKRLFMYANHLHDNDRWPMGDVHSGVALPPAIDELSIESIWSHALPMRVQIDKALALRMQHDLQTKLTSKKKLRRYIQSVLLGRKWPDIEGSDYFRKAVRRHEFFFIKDLC